MNERTIDDAAVITVADSAALAGAAAGRFVEIAQKSIADRDVFYVALSGGGTPRATYEALAGPELRETVDWGRVQLFFSDERFVPPDSAESNFHMAREALLDHVPIPERFVHQVSTLEITPDESAALYEQGMRRVFAVSETDVPRFDLILLGLGPDGHTASLFPNTEALTDYERLVAPNFLPQSNVWRITFTYRLINAARTIIFLAQGAEKAGRVQQVLARDADLPASGVRPLDGDLIWLLDNEAAAQVPPG